MKMRNTTWTHWVVAAILILIAGAVMVAAEDRIEVKVEKRGPDEVTVDINGVTDVIRLDDLAEGESRSFDVGEHELVVTRVGDELEVISEGHPFAALGDRAKGLETVVWVSEDGDEIEISGDGETVKKKVMIVNVDDDADGEPHVYTLHVDGDDVTVDGDSAIVLKEIMSEGGFEGDHAIFIAGGDTDDHPMIWKSCGMHGGKVAYRCDETGSILLVDEDDALEDSYICPATGCVMTRIEEPKTRVIKIEKRIESDDDND